MKFDNKEDIIQLTPLWKGERYPNGRPKVSDDILERMKEVALEEAWSPLFKNGYTAQFEGDFKTVHPKKVMVGRAVTTVMVPKRPDLHDTLLAYGKEEEGRKGFFNQWVVDTLEENDIVVVDLFDKIFQGTYVGGNLTTAIAARTKQGGSVIWGGVRDLEQMQDITSIQTYYRGNDPTAIKDVTMVGMNTPCRIGKAICMPGDIVLGTQAGVLFIPPHMAELCLEKAEKTKMRDIFGFIRLKEGKYSTAQIDGGWAVELWEDFIDWFGKSEEAVRYRYLSFDDELQKAREKEENGGGPSDEVRL